MSARFLSLTLLLVLSCLPAIAQADRAPSKRERAAIAGSADVPKRCLRIRISTVNRRYASVYIRNARRSCRRWAADGVAVYKRGRARWRFVVAGSAFECPVPKVPRRVVRDLGIECH
jgi:hypothetical protein